MARAARKPKIPPMKTVKEPEVSDMQLSSVQILVKVDIYKEDKKVGEGFFGPQNEEGQGSFEFYNIDDVVDFMDKLPKMLQDAVNGKVS